MAVAETEVARKEAGRIVVRSGAVRLRWVFDDLTSSDGHTLRAVLSAAVQAVDDAAERRLLEEAFLTRGSAVTSADVAEFFGNSLEPAARRAAGAGEAASLLSDAGRNALLNKLIDMAKGVAFGCGLEVLPPFELELEPDPSGSAAGNSSFGDPDRAAQSDGQSYKAVSGVPGDCSAACGRRNSATHRSGRSG